MKSYVRLALSATMGGLLSLAVGLPPAFADDAAKLKELERAMNAPIGGVEGPKKIKTRAIVFDNEPQPAAPVEAAAPVGVGNCGALPPDVKSLAVGFSIQFKLGSAEVAPSSEKTLLEIARILSLSPDRCVLVEGHTDSTGNADRNMKLSRDRAESVVKFITEKAGANRSRFVPIGKGSTDPEKNLDPRNPQNRRVVFKVVG